ncbi:MAG: M15 family metallopeptidase [Acidimicrobiia bacterium]|jgi:hypothetical protein
MRPRAIGVVLLVLGACSAPAADPEPATPVPQTTTTAPVTPTTQAPTTTVAPTTTTSNPFARPDWLGTRPLPLRPDGHGEVQPTPPELVDRQLETPGVLGFTGMVSYEFTIEPIPPDVLARSSWTEECPVTVDELRYLTMTHVGFDGEFHVGEMIVNASAAEDIVEVFRKLFDARFPIEQMRVITAEEIDAHPTGDWNDTTSFVCRPAVGSANWSQHAFGLAIDINPFHNPYLKGDLVLPELASAYLDRDYQRPGMIFEGDVATHAFDEIGWGWGGRWNTLKDWMHFSRSGR